MQQKEEKRQVVVFDFDGTITHKDSFLQFIAFTHGWPQLCFGMLLNIHWVIACYVLRTISNEALKQRIFSYFFRGMRYETFCRYGQSFVSRIETFENRSIVKKLHEAVRDGHTVFVISASIYEWLWPWCQKHGVENVISTRIDVNDDGFITGYFSSKNCYGPEKMVQFLLAEPHRTEYCLTVYGDSRGDREIMAIADEKHWVS